MSLLRFKRVFLVDFEYGVRAGERPEPLCCVAHELLGGMRIRLWEDELRALPAPPYDISEDSLFVSYYAPAELSCHLALGWSLPANILDLFAEFRRNTNGSADIEGASLLAALRFYGLSAMDEERKEAMRRRILLGGTFTPVERQSILDYCESDVLALEQLLGAMELEIAPELDRALLRGRFMAAVARMEAVGVPIDVPTLRLLSAHWDRLLAQLVADVDVDFAVFEGTHFREARFERWLAEAGLAWPRLASGRLALDDDTFKEQATLHPELEPLRQLRRTLSQLRPSQLAVGADGCNRVMLSPLRSKTGRNQPASSSFVLGKPAWFRSLIKPAPGQALAYIDWEQQEFGIAAALSRDPAMMAAYRSGDPYLAFARQAGGVPPYATKSSHPAERELFKQCALAVLYGMSADGLARKLGIPRGEAAELLLLHRRVYRRFWEWSDAMVDGAMLLGRLHTVFGWEIHISDGVNPRMLRNFPMQANGAEMMRVAAILMTERGIRVGAPLHDAFLIDGAIDEIDDAVVVARSAMAEASIAVLGELELRSDVTITRFPERFTDRRGKAMWDRVSCFLEQLRTEQGFVGANDEAAV
jgi:hypothetical protein